MNDQDKTKEELLIELQELQQEHNSLKAIKDKAIIDRKQLEESLRRANDELEIRIQERTTELVKANEVLHNEIAGQKRAEVALRVSETLFSMMIESVKDYAIIMLDTDGFVVNWNKGAENIKGYQAGEIIGQHISRFYPREDVESGKPERELTVANNKGRFEEEGWRVRKDGSRFIANVNITALRDESGKLRGFAKITRDITERKLAEEALKTSEEKYRLLSETAEDIIVLYNNSGEISYTNTIGQKYFRLTEKKFQGRSVFEFVPEKYHELLKNNFKERLSGFLGSRLLEIELINRQGTSMPVEIRSTPIVVSGNITGFISICRDITNRKNAEKIMREYADQYRTLLSTALFGFWLVDEKGKLLDVNDAYCTMSGYTREEVFNLSITDIEVNDKPEEIAAHKQRVIKSGTDLFEGRHKAKDGHVFDVEISMGFLYYQKQFILFIRDITERKQAEEKIRKIGLHYQTLIEKASDGIVLLDAEAKFKFVSNPAKKMFGYSVSDEITQNPAELTHPDDLNMVLSNLARLFEDPSYIPTLQYRFAAKNGNWIWVETTFSNFLADPNVESIVLNFRNITERKRAEEELIIAKEHAEESDRLKSAFLANMSHEIRTPLNGILGFAELLKTPELSGKQQQEYIRIIKKSGDRMLNIINDIIDISKIEAGLMEVNIKESNINEQIEYIYTFFKPEVEGKGLQLFFKNTLPTKEAILKTDREKVTAIFINLVKNAIKFSDKGSIGLGYEKKGKYIEFFVTDTGIGIPKDRQEAIFNRFVQADIGDRRAFQGAGLGLSISKAYVEMLGGKIRVQSEEGKGSTFYFTIPYTIEEQTKTVINNIAPAEVAEDHIKKLKILIAEDDQTSEMLISLAVKIYSKEILTVTTGNDAVETCRNTPDLNLIFMDIKMLGMNGYEATRQIRQFNKDVVIIAQTAFGQKGDREKAITAGCDDYISKPTSLALLKGIVQKHFQNK